MMKPSLEEVKMLAKEYNLIPVSMEVMGDVHTVIELYKTYHDEAYSFLLESVEGGQQWARYSYIGKNPFMIVSCKEGTTSVLRNQKQEVHQGHPIDVLKTLLNAYKSPQQEDLPPFTGGAVGYFGYDILQYFQQIPPHATNQKNTDELKFLFVDELIVFDHFKHSIQFVSNVHIPEGASDQEIESAYEAARQVINETMDHINSAKMNHYPSDLQPMIPQEVQLENIRSNMSKEEFFDMVHKAKDYIAAGDIFQVVLSQCFEMDVTADPLDVYRVLRVLNPSAYMYVLKMPDEVIVGSSPELLVKVDGDEVRTRPIAGTRPRGMTPLEDEQLAQELLADQKEVAEHLMLVDLGRNDIGRVSAYGSVDVASFMKIEKYSHVMHIVSDVVGTLRSDQDFFDALVSCMPAGTLSGAPKVRAMQIIAELEKEARGPYGGAIGYLSFSGNMDSCITIRTILFKHGKAYIQAGAGIVADSVAQSEYEETFNKAKALLKAIQTAEAMQVSL
ncbi:anthranilate synthase component I [Fictibacillus macauensis ZFHKF-1]|uniref:Anthranilate synthase component 1 n=1 Tax=Fictibacillus macauensis ZFHKF-1 TaxID=1196324 RepID=I8J5N7_9BACL|nr:anthranilate synthase component I [Fictibacillus macauensis]EIT87116.1 anthranilate synthase component I [Fictibacillus macauensis ZFHKF-1]